MALGVAEACLRVGPTSLVLRLCPLCYFHQVSGFLGSPHFSSGPAWSFLPRTPENADPLYLSFPSLIFLILPVFGEQTRASMAIRMALMGLTLARLLSIPVDFTLPKTRPELYRTRNAENVVALNPWTGWVREG